MKTLLRIGAWASVVAGCALLIWDHIERQPAEYRMIAVGLLILPVSLARVLKQSDARSRRNWAILLGFVVVLGVIEYLAAP